MTRPHAALLLPVLLALAALTGACGGNSTQAGGASASSGGGEIRYQGWANQVTLPELAADLGYLPGVKLTWIGNTFSGSQDLQATTSGQIDVGGSFDGSVAKLALSGAPIQAVVAYYGTDKDAYTGFYTLPNSPIKSARDLIGKKIGVNSLGGYFEAVIDTYLAQQGLSPDEIKQVQLVTLPPPNTDQALRAGQIDVASLLGQFRDEALAKGGIREIFKDSTLFGDISVGSYVFRKDFIAKHPDLVRTFVDGVGKAIDWTKSTPHDEVIARYTKVIESRHRQETTGTLKYWRSIGVATKHGVLQESDFTRWESWLVQTGAIQKGQLDAKTMYTNHFNPAAGTL
jgi:ABC-type nitrate/sulfonate/bicarbonate transport system substrate-binding protein